MSEQLLGLHHVTAVTGHASANVAFYTRTLGLRLVKKTVNQDDVSAYHLFYADERGSPGTDLTFFDWPQSPPRVPGTGSIAPIALRVPGRAALDWWAERLSAHGVPHGPIVALGPPGAERATLAFADPEGQLLQLVDDGGAPGGTPWPASPVPIDKQITGLHAVTLTVSQLEPTAFVLTQVLGFRLVGQYPCPDAPALPTFVYEVGPGGPGTEVRVAVRPDLPFAQPGIGGVHHVAFRTPNDEEQRRWRWRIAQAGLQVTPVVDRFYFRSIYFREPGGVLYEIATDGPGFGNDEDAAHLGERLALPPFLEPYRRQIEAGLRPL